MACSKETTSASCSSLWLSTVTLLRRHGPLLPGRRHHTHQTEADHLSGAFTAALEDRGLRLSPKRCNSSHTVEQRPWIQSSPPGWAYQLLGAACGSGAFCQEAIDSQIDRVLGLLAILPKLESPAVAVFLMRFCLSWCQLSYHARTTPPKKLLLGGHPFEERSFQCSSALLHTLLSEKSWRLVQVSIAKGGFRIRDPVIHSH